MLAHQNTVRPRTTRAERRREACRPPRTGSRPMPPTNPNDPLRTTDHEESAAPPAPDSPSDVAAGSSAVGVPGDGTPTGGQAGHAPGSVSVSGYEILGVLGRGGM